MDVPVKCVLVNLGIFNIRTSGFEEIFPFLDGINFCQEKRFCQVKFPVRRGEKPHGTASPVIRDQLQAVKLVVLSPYVINGTQTEIVLSEVI